MGSDTLHASTNRPRDAPTLVHTEGRLLTSGLGRGLPCGRVWRSGRRSEDPRTVSLQRRSMATVSWTSPWMRLPVVHVPPQPVRSPRLSTLSTGLLLILLFYQIPLMSKRVWTNGRKEGSSQERKRRAFRPPRSFHRSLIAPGIPVGDRLSAGAESCRSRVPCRPLILRP